MINDILPLCIQYLNTDQIIQCLTINKRINKRIYKSINIEIPIRYYRYFQTKFSNVTNILYLYGHPRMAEKFSKQINNNISGIVMGNTITSDNEINLILKHKDTIKKINAHGYRYSDLPFLNIWKETIKNDNKVSTLFEG